MQQPVRRDPQALLKTAFSLPGGPCTRVKPTCQEASLLNYLMLFLACMFLSVPTVVLMPPRLLSQLARPRSRWQGAELWHSSARSRQDKSLTSELKCGQRLRAIKSILLQIVQMGKLLKEARVLAGEIRFWRVLPLQATEAAAGEGLGLLGKTCVLKTVFWMMKE